METIVDMSQEAMVRLELPADELAGVRVRRHLDSLDYQFEEEIVELLKLTATELVTNAVLHSGARENGNDIVVFVRLGPPSLLLKVCDRGPGVKKTVERADPLAEGGRGLFLVDALSRSWGTSKVRIDGEIWSCVWACFGEEALPCRRAG